MIFVVGARRSGTLWVERMLSAHRDVRALPSETHLFSHGIRPMADRISHGILSAPDVGALYMDREPFLAATRALCDAIMLPFLGDAPTAGARLLERSPWHVYHLDLIGALYPDAHIVHVVRDGRSVVRSLLAQSWGPDSMEAAAREWVGAITGARRAAPRLARFKEIRYETLLSDPAAGVTDLYRWLGLETSDEQLDAGLVATSRQDNIDITTPWITRDKWRGQLTPEQLTEFNDTAGDVLRSLGYEDDGPAMVAEGPPQKKAPKRRPRRPQVDESARRQERIALRKRVLRVMNQFLSLVGEHGYHRLDELFSPEVEITIADGEVRSVQGDDAIRTFTKVLADDEDARAQQVTGEVFVDGHMATAVQVHRGADGAPSTRTYVASVQDDRLVRLSYFRFPAL